MLDGVKRLLLREAQVQPLLVVFEDLHWIDSETQALLDSLVESLPPARLLLFVNYRPEYEHHWGSKTSYTQLRLDPLPPERAFELLHGLLGADGTIEPLTPFLIERTEGNPFFLEESVRALVETKALVGERGAYRLVKVLADIQVPLTVQAILAARIDRLSPEDKRLLQSAAVIGKDVPLALLAAIAEEREDDLRQGLARLQAAEFLYEVSLFPDLEYTFMHALTYEVAYGSVLHERRRALHARLVEVIETLYGDRLAEHVEQLAHHAFLAEVWPKAATYLGEAAAKANGRCAYRQAAGWFEQALGAVAKLPDSRAKAEQSIDIMCGIRGTLLPLGEASRAFGHLREAERLARVIDDRRRLAMVLGAMSHHYWFEGDPAETRRFGEEALEAATAVGDLSIQISVSNRLGMAHMFWGEALPAQLLLRNVVDLVGEDTVLTSSINTEGVTCRALLASTLAPIGEFRKGLDYGEEALRIAEHFDHPNSVAHALLHLSWLCDLQGNLPRALSLGQRGISICRELNISFRLVSLLGIVGHAQVRSGRPDEALLGLKEGLAIQEAIGYRSTMSAMVSMLAEAYLAAGQLPAASDEARRALALARECGERFEEARALWVLEHVHAHTNHLDLEPADQAYQQSLVLATALDMRPLVAQCHLGLAKLSRLTGNRRQAEEHLSTATTMFREMDMPFWLEKAAAELAALR
jgi:tetratricopeptide (TPR) repeat protein